MLQLGTQGKRSNASSNEEVRLSSWRPDAEGPTPPPDTPEPLLERFRDGLTTQEVAALLALRNDAPNQMAAEAALIELVAGGRAIREPLGDGALWRLQGR